MAKQSGLTSLLESIDRLSTREKVMLGGLIAAVSLTVIFGIYWLVGRNIDSLEERNREAYQTLSQIMIQKDSYLLEKAKIEANQKELDRNKLRLVEEMERAAKAQDFKIEDFKEGKRYLTENSRKAKKRDDDSQAPKRKVKDLVEETQTVTIRDVTLKQLAGFLSILEGRREPVRVTLLNITVKSSDRQKLREVRLTVATYRNEETEI